MNSRNNGFEAFRGIGPVPLVVVARERSEVLMASRRVLGLGWRNIGLSFAAASRKLVEINSRMPQLRHSRSKGKRRLVPRIGSGCSLWKY